MLKRILIPCLATLMMACGNSNTNEQAGKDAKESEGKSVENKEPKKVSGIGVITQDALNAEILPPMEYPA